MPFLLFQMVRPAGQLRSMIGINRTVIRTFKFLTLHHCHFKSHSALAMSQLRNPQVIGTSAA